ncbi:MAG TPA: ABC transporter permease [Ilumatobacteraceae bacterium]|nr:ABC transporter permease [Ilumatobacteraceae bacterium]
MTESIEQGDVNRIPVESPPGPVKSFAFAASDLIARRREASIAFVAVVLFVYFAASTPAFMGVDNMRVISQYTASVAILAIAEAMLLISGEIDLSLGHIYAMTPFLMYFGTEAGLPLPVAVVLALLGAGVVGLLNGIMTVATGVPSFITTLGMLFFLQGFTLTISDGFPKNAPEDGISDILGGARFAGFIWAAVVMVLVHILLVNTRWGIYTVATGGNPVGAREAGIQVKRIKVGNFVLAAMLAGFTGISEAIRVTSIDPLAGGSNLMFLGIAAAVIGGTALAGGSGTVIGAFLGAVVLGVLRDGLIVKGISSFTYNIILGIFIIASMFLNAAANHLRIRMRKFA